MTYEQWLKGVKHFTLPRYNDLPEIPLYLDQVLEYVNVKMKPLFRNPGNELTGAMINNYVKHKMMPAPTKKRYHRDHLAYIITISILKQMINIQSIALGIQAVRNEFGKEDAYDAFVGFVEDGIQQVLAQTHEHQSIYLGEDKIETTLVPMKAACIAFAAKLIAEHALESLLEEKKDESR